MAYRSSFLPRLSLSKDAAPLLPFHSNSASPPLRAKRSEYDLTELSPRSDYAPSSIQRDPVADEIPTRSETASDHMASPSAYASPRSSHRVLFAGPPAPIAKSTLLYRDVEEEGEPDLDAKHSPKRERFSASQALGSVLFSRGGPSTRDPASQYDPDSVWRGFHRREKALESDAQRLLDVQASGLSAGLGRPLSASPSPVADLAASRAASGSSASSPVRLRGPGDRPSLSRSRPSLLDPPTRANAKGEVIPVRQPRAKPMGLRAARAGLGRTLALLADLKAEEDAALDSALSSRKHALNRLRQMSARREGLAGELRALESDDEEPLARELRELRDEHGGVCSQITELEEKLAVLQQQRRRLEGEMATLVNRREAGLSGYRGALKEVEAQIATVLRRPAVRPLDVSAFAAASHQSEEDGEGASPGGLEFLRLRPERRTASMASDWWESEVAILERRKLEIENERLALEEGAEVWSDAVRLVSDFEADLRNHMKAEWDTDSTGNQMDDGRASQEDTLLSQLDKMRAVITGLEDHLQTAEGKNWNLLICAIGAELEAFKEAHIMLRGALVASGLDADEDTPRLARSTADTGVNPPVGQEKLIQSPREKSNDLHRALVEIQEDANVGGENEAAADVASGHAEAHSSQPRRDDTEEGSTASLEREDSENEVPPEFLMEHRSEDDTE